jgi:hypothetical protein
VFIAQPDTVLRWHRAQFRLVWRRTSQPKQQGGRRPLPGRVVQLIRRMARENLLRGAERIRGEMLKQNINLDGRNSNNSVRISASAPRVSRCNWASRGLTFSRSRSHSCGKASAITLAEYSV